MIKELSDIKNKKTVRRLKFLMSKHSYVPKYQILKWQVASLRPYTYNKEYLKVWNDLMECHLILDKFNIDEPTRQSIWVPTNVAQYERSEQYKLKPIRVRKDNKDSINFGTGGGSNRNRIRFPSMKRKGAWKRFVKLFPQYSEMNPYK